MRTRSVCVAAVMFLSLACRANALTPPPGSPLANREHPRIWLTQSNLPTLRAKLAGDFRPEFQAFVTDLDRRVADPEEWGWWKYDVANYAFVYRVGSVAGITYGNTIATYGQRAKVMLNDAVADNRNVAPGLALAYDWIFDLLSPAERTGVVNILKQTPHGNEGSGGNPWASSVIRQRRDHVMAGLAFWGDGIDDGAANAMVDKYATRISGPDGYLEALSFLAGTEGAWGGGLSYSANEGSGMSVPHVLEAWRTANGLTRAAVFGAPDANVLRYYPRWALYHILPHATSCGNCPGGQRYMLYRTHNMNAAQAAHGFAELDDNLAALRLYKNIDPDTAGLAQWLIDNRTSGIENGVEAQINGVFANFIAGEKGVTPKSPTALGLPLTSYFQNYGWVVMRTGWNSLTDTMVTFMASPWSRMTGSYTNFNQGSFTIDRRGPLVLNSGTAIHHEYGNSTWAYNTIIFPDPNEAPRPNFWDKGGQRYVFPQLYSRNDLNPGGENDLGGVRRLLPAGANRNTDYIFADVTRAYNGPANSEAYNTQKVRSFTRQVVYFRPEAAGDTDRIVVYDRTETVDSRFEKRWLLHPSTGGGDVTINGSGTQVRPGKTEYANADLVTATNTSGGSNGRIFSKTLLPAGRKIVKIGGPGHEYEDPYGNNDIVDMLPGDAQYTGTYRVEVIPTVASTSDLFLHVIEAADAAAASPTPSGLLSGINMVGARVGQRIAAFSRTEAAITSGDIVVDQTGTYGVMICDLQPGAEYEVGQGNFQTASGAGSIFVDVQVGAPNSRLQVRLTNAPPPQPPRAPAPPTNVRVIR